MSLEDIFAGCCGETDLERAVVTSCFEDTPERISLTEIDLEEYSDVFKSVSIDDVETGYVRCYHECCSDKIIILKNNNRRSFTFPRHVKDQHLTTGYGRYGLRRHCQARPEHETEQLLAKAIVDAEKKPTHTRVIWANFVHTERFTKKGATKYDCCWCTFSLSKNSTKFREHLVQDCTNCPDEVKDKIRKKEKEMGLAKTGWPTKVKPKERFIYRNLGLKIGSKSNSGAKDLGHAPDIENYNEIFDDQMDSSDDSIDLQIDPEPLNSEVSRQKAVEILTQLLADQKDVHDKIGKRKVDTEQEEKEKLMKLSDADLDREIKCLQIQHLRTLISRDISSRRSAINQREEELLRKEEELELKMMEIRKREENERHKFFNNLEITTGDGLQVSLTRLIQDVFEAVINDD